MIPACPPVPMSITADGAQGGTGKHHGLGGNGAKVEGHLISLTAGEELEIIVGQRGANGFPRGAAVAAALCSRGTRG